MNGKLGSADHMEMQVEYSLSGVGAAVRNDAITVCASSELCNIGNLLEYFCNNTAVFSIDFINGSDVFFGYYKYMTGSFGIDILEREHIIVFVNLGRGDFTRYNFTEKAVHFQSPLYLNYFHFTIKPKKLQYCV